MLLDGRELAGFIKERQAKAVRGMQHLKTVPHLAIVQVGEELVSSKYISLKQKYGQDIGIKVSLHSVSEADLDKTIKALNKDKSVHGIIVQLPLPEGTDTESVLNGVAPGKDVDGLGKDSKFDTAAPVAILWLLSGYNVDLNGKKVLVVGQGRLVGEPLAKMLQNSGIEPVVCDEDTENLADAVQAADVVIAATGQPGLITTLMLKPKTTVIDAGTAYVEGVLEGDVHPAVYERKDIKVSPVPGGVGPLTVCALFENVITAARNYGQ